MDTPRRAAASIAAADEEEVGAVAEGVDGGVGGWSADGLAADDGVAEVEAFSEALDHGFHEESGVGLAVLEDAGSEAVEGLRTGRWRGLVDGDVGQWAEDFDRVGHCSDSEYEGLDGSRIRVASHRGEARSLLFVWIHDDDLGVADESGLLRFAARTPGHDLDSNPTLERWRALNHRAATQYLAAR